MGGLLVAVEWSGDRRDSDFRRAAEGLSARGPAGTRITISEPVMLAEARTARDGPPGWGITESDGCSIVGDLRLWDRSGESGHGPGDDRRGVLARVAQHGPHFAEHIDGDFAVVIWDAQRRTLTVARDRFGIKPLWLHHVGGTRTVIASDVRAIRRYLRTDPEPDAVRIREHLANAYTPTPRSFFTGIERVMPATCLEISADLLRVRRYWSLVPEPSEGHPVAVFRASLIDAVRRRSTGGVVAQLSGGLDSPSIAAAASTLTPSGLDPADFVTASLVAPGIEGDESARIRELVRSLPFDHVEFEQPIGSVDDYVEDMALTGTPIALPLRSVQSMSAAIAVDRGASTVLTGDGGDEAGDDAWVLAELWRKGGTRAWLDAVRGLLDEDITSGVFWASQSMRRRMPQGFKRAGTLLRRPRTTPTLGHVPPDGSPPQHPVRSLAEALGTSITTGNRLISLEMTEARIAALGVAVSHPFLDRHVLETVAGLDPAMRPLDPRGKSLQRSAFANELPRSVVENWHKPLADAQAERIMVSQAREYRRRYPVVPDVASPYVDAQRYADAVATSAAGAGSFAETRRLWAAWTLFQWLESLSDGTA